jgi:hypothetical protein
MVIASTFCAARFLVSSSIQSVSLSISRKLCMTSSAILTVWKKCHLHALESWTKHVNIMGFNNRVLLFYFSSMLCIFHPTYRYGNKTYKIRPKYEPICRLLQIKYRKNTKFCAAMNIL